MASEYGIPSRKGEGSAMVITLVLVLVLAILVPIVAGPVQQREQQRKTICIANLKKVTHAKIAWQENTSASCDDEPTEKQLLPYLAHEGLDTMPTCPSGGEYHLGTVENEPTCDFSTTVAGARITHAVEPLTQ